MKKIVALLCLVLAGCHPVNRDDVVTLLHALEQINNDNIVDPDQQTRFLMQACAEVPYCALGCKKSFLAAGASPNAPAAALIAECSHEFKNASPQPAPSAWFRSYLKGRLDAGRGELTDVEKTRLDDLSAQIGGLH